MEGPKKPLQASRREAATGVGAARGLPCSRAEGGLLGPRCPYSRAEPITPGRGGFHSPKKPRIFGSFDLF